MVCPLPPQSNCFDSVVLLLSIHVHTDIDECLMGTSGCQQLCFNTNGSYYCQCNTGYRLMNDNSSCDGMYSYCILCVL